MRTRAILFATSLSGWVSLAAGNALADAPGTLDISTSDGRGTISVDGGRVGAGAFHGDIAAGAHEIVVERAGFKRYAKSVTVESGKSVSLSVSLEREAAAAPPPPPAEPYSGFYGGFLLGPSFEPGGSGSTLEQSCSLIGAVSCATSPPGGIALAGNFGYTWDPVGIEIFAAFALDYTTPTATFDGKLQPGSNAALTGPARVESFRIVRTGGMGAVRARATWNGSHIRAWFAGGVGFGVHVMAMDRNVVTTDGSDQKDIFAPQPVSYITPAVSFEAGAALRITKSIAVTAGVSVWIENAGSNTTTLADPQHYFLPSGTPLRTPSYRLAGAAQVFVWPFVGMQFGP